MESGDYACFCKDNFIGDKCIECDSGFFDDDCKGNMLSNLAHLSLL